MNHVFIPSRGRWQGAAKLTKVWRNNGFHVHWVVEPEEHDQYFDALAIPMNGVMTPGGASVNVHPLPLSNKGIAYSRSICVRLAHGWGIKAIILADDDIKPGKDANMKNFVDCAKHKQVLGITARYSYHDLCLGNKIKGRDDLILLPTGTFRLVSLNVQNVMELGNYDTNLEYAEDCDLLLRGLKAGYPWMVHLGTWANSTGTRYQPGGLLDYVDAVKGPNFTSAVKNIALATKKYDWHKALYAKYPEVVNNPEKADFTKQNSIRIQWQRAYDLWLPEWRKWSMLHGGFLAYYLGLVDESV